MANIWIDILRDYYPPHLILHFMPYKRKCEYTRYVRKACSSGQIGLSVFNKIIFTYVFCQWIGIYTQRYIYIYIYHPSKTLFNWFGLGLAAQAIGVVAELVLVQLKLDELDEFRIWSMGTAFLFVAEYFIYGDQCDLNWDERMSFFLNFEFFLYITTRVMQFIYFWTGILKVCSKIN